MRVVLWLLALFGIAVAVALFAGNNQALVSVFWPPHRVDISLNLLLLLLVGFFALLHGALRALAALFSLPADARAWRAQQKERALYDALVESQAHWLAGRYIRAARAANHALSQEKSLALLAVGKADSAATGPSADDSRHALGSARASQVRALAHLLAAESAQSLQNKPLRESHLQSALESSAVSRQSHSLRESLLFRAARWALEDRDPAAALDWLAQLPQGAARRTLALRLRLQAAQQARQPQQALETARLLAKHGAFTPAVGRSIVRGLVLERIAGAEDAAQLQQVWQSLDAAERSAADLAIPAAARLMALAADTAPNDTRHSALGNSHKSPRHPPDTAVGEANSASIQARAWLLPVWEQLFPAGGASTGAGTGTGASLLQGQGRFDQSSALRSQLVSVLEAGLNSIDPAWLGRIEAAQRSYPQDAALRYLAGMACLNRQLWGKARQLLDQAAPALQAQPVLQRKAWCTLGMLADQRGDAVAADHAYRQAAAV